MQVCSLLAVLGELALVAAKSAQLIQSADGTADRLTSRGDVGVIPDFEFAGPTVSVSADMDQELWGFGGAFTESAALVFWGLPEAERARLLELYFGEDGLGYVFGRTHINSCDFSPDYYTFDEVDGDFDLVHFDDNVTHDTTALIPFIKAAQQVLQKNGRELKLLATAWSPPAWMKNNSQMKGSDTPGLKDSCKATWAKYFSRWITAYKNHGIPIWAVTPENEPENNGMWESCVFPAQYELDFIASELGPTLKADHPDVKLFLFDHNKDDVLDWVEALYSHPEAMQYTSGIAYHWYTGDYFESVQEIHRRFPDAIMMSTEATYDQSRLQGASIADGNWDFALGYAHEIIGDFNAGTVAWFDWNLILDQDGGPNKVGNNCDAPMISDGEHLIIHPQYYAIGHFSKYIPPGSKRLVTSVSKSHSYVGAVRTYGTCDASDGLQATAFRRPDGIIAVVALNCGEEAIDFKLQHGADAIMASIPKRAIQTYLLQGDSDILVV